MKLNCNRNVISPYKSYKGKFDYWKAFLILLVLFFPVLHYIPANYYPLTILVTLVVFSFLATNTVEH